MSTPIPEAPNSEPEVVVPADEPAVATTPALTFVHRARNWARANLDHAIGLALGFVYTLWLLTTTRVLGFSRDESFYFDASTRYGQWFELLFKSPGEAIKRPAIDAYWSANHEHPSLMKSLFALSHLFLHQRHKVFADASDAFRFPGIVMAGVALWITYLFGTRVHSRIAGVTAAVALALMPRIFYHSHLACFDIPVMTMWVFCIYTYYRAHRSRSWKWALALGMVYGLTLETKHNSWMLPPLFLLHAFLTMMLARDKKTTAEHWFRAFPWHLIALAVIGPLVFVGLWPWLWNDPESRFREYVSFHVNHDYYNIEFLHQNYWGPPSPPAYAPVMIAATVPTVTVALFMWGASVQIARVAKELWSLRPWQARATPSTKPAEAATTGPSSIDTDLLLLMGFSVPLAVFFLPKTPIFGGTKHWFPAYPFFCIFAGIGFAKATTIAREALAQTKRASFAKCVQPVFAVVLGLPPLLETIHSHPFGLSEYVPMIGGTRGAAKIGLYRQFWGFTTQSLNAYLVRTSKPGERIFIHDTTWGAFYQMQQEGRLPNNLSVVWDMHDADIAIVHHELHMIEVDANIMTVFGHPDPDFVLTHDGVPIISVWRRKAK